MKLFDERLEFLFTRLCLPGPFVEWTQLQGYPVDDRSDVVVTSLNFVARGAHCVRFLAIIVIKLRIRFGNIQRVHEPRPLLVGNHRCNSIELFVDVMQAVADLGHISLADHHSRSSEAHSGYLRRVDSACFREFCLSCDLLFRTPHDTPECSLFAFYGGKILKRKSFRDLDFEKALFGDCLQGIGDYLEEDLAEALKVYPKAVDIIEGPLMAGMNHVGDLFGAGKMFLPQVVKTARTMKKAVAVLQPVIESEKQEGAASAGKVLLATVKGDVHDIGKNIVSVVMACNGYEIIDLGVMVPAETIVQRAIEEKVDMIGLSGLITPSLEEMAHVAIELEKAGLDIPLLIGGATTSKMHTALKIAPVYHAPVVHLKDASQNASVASRLLNPQLKAELVNELEAEYEALREKSGLLRRETVSLEEAQKNKLNLF